MTQCPCDSKRDYDECCGPIIGGDRAAPTAEALMRARYTAFLGGDFAFLDATLAPEKRDEVDRETVEDSMRDAQGTGVEIRAVEGGGAEDDEAVVEYLARFRMRGQPHLHHEKGRFRRENGAWVYVDGEVNPKQAQRVVAKVGRNDPCPCGSGQKYKKCCGG